MFVFLSIPFAHHLLIGLQSFTTDLQNKISKLSTSSNYVSNLQINTRIKELLLQELKCKQKIKNKQLNKSKLKQKKNTMIKINRKTRENMKMKLIAFYMLLVIKQHNYTI